MAEKVDSGDRQREGTPAEPGRIKFGTMSGVFTPTLLTILGVIMFLREGWVVGQVGLVAAWAIILLAFVITGCTALSMSSVATNIRVGAGGAYSIISQSLGIEIGGAIGIPLYLSQTLAVAMYVFGFRAGWTWIFPDHPALVVDLVTFAVVFGIAFISAGLAFRVQYIILAIILGSLGAVAWAAATGSMQHPVPWGPPEEGGGFGFPGNFWVVFAVFFPAATGIMAGANMSGDLKDPRKSIPVGTLSAIGISLAVYAVLAYWLARSATVEELRNNYTVLIDRSALPPLALAGLLGATFSSAMGSIVGSPRILQALAVHRITPLSGWLKHRTAKGEPRNALYLSAAIILGALMLRDLNAIAPLITMFFLITYAMINTVVFIEQQMGLVSFRPLFGIPSWVAPLGVIGCIAAMFIVNPPFGLVAVVVVMAFYAYLARRHLKAPFGDVRSGVFVSVSEWAAKKVSRLPEDRTRGWKANLLAPVRDPARLRGDFRLLHSLAYPRGSVTLLGVRESEDPDFSRQMRWLSSAFRGEDLFSSWAVVNDDDFGRAVVSASSALEAAFFQPNVVFLSLEEDGGDEGRLLSVANFAAQHTRLGLLVFAEHAKAGLGRQGSINLHIRRPQAGWGWQDELGSLNLAALACYKLRENWQAEMRILAWAHEEDEKDAAREYIRRLAELGRLEGISPMVRVGSEGPCPDGVPPADLHCLATDSCDFDEIRRMRDEMHASCLVVPSAGNASVLA